ncbi:protein phosphatase 1K, mitochondrial-like isoform X2 [Centruroides sculpturatus]|uniref:protein phosphatase 1K, mitochondrial-like isoform X2 n=1 Tax=Centruroides sculpturatus TaxID=218467 RepID=UPI000C6DBC3E|nr:protein phosphatase 1K, mitochondrial-like isoform X2 [Centruroides sculpturatus]
MKKKKEEGITMTFNRIKVNVMLKLYQRIYNSSLKHHSLLKNYIKTFATVLNDSENKDESPDPINFDTFGTWDNRIDLPLLLPESIKHGKPIPQISVENAGCASIIGRRTTNEDRFRAKELLPDLLYFAVFDGHGGAECADFCSKYMEQHILNVIKRGEQNLEVVLQTAFFDVNNSFTNYFKCSEGNEQSSGTTATVCLLKNSIELVIGHVGDSRAILCRNGDNMTLTINHAADLKSERERILKSGGYITSDSLGRNLVNGRLDMTRSLGDIELAQYGVIALPDTRSLQVKHGKDSFVILTTDGINVALSDQEICDSVNNCTTPAEAANFITDQAMQFGSQDNATAVIVPFGAWGKFQNYSGIKYNFGRTLTHSSRY